MSNSDDSDFFASARPQIIVKDPRVKSGNANLMEAISDGKPVFFYAEPLDGEHSKQAVQVCLLHIFDRITTS